jgi:hydrogenase expression/formation protein HypC
VGRLIWRFGANDMCLAIPGKILTSEDLGFARMGRVQFGGTVRQVRLDFVPEAAPGDYVMVHVGFAISKVDEEEAQRTYQVLVEMGTQMEEELPPVDAPPEKAN